MSFVNKVILITGASSGIGAGAAIHLARKGASIALVGRNQNRLNDVKEQITNAGGPNPLVISADINTDADRIMKETSDRFGKLDVLINNAGTFGHSSIVDVDMDEYDRIINTNIRSAIYLTKLAIPHLEKTKGNILNVSSASGLRVKRNILATSIAKASMNQFTKSAALDLAPKGIRVNAICPVTVRTPTFETHLGWSREEADKFFESGKNFPLGRVAEVDDISNAIEFLTGDSASFITGELLSVDGGAVIAGL